EAALGGQARQQRAGAGVPAVLGQVGEDAGCLDGEVVEAPGVGCERGAQVELPAARVVVRLQRLPGVRLVAADNAHRAASISASSLTESAAKARMPSASFSVAIASSLSAKRNAGSSKCTRSSGSACAASASSTLGS